MVGTCGKTTRNKPRVMVERRGEKAYCRKDGETRLKRMHGSEKVQTLRKRRKNKKFPLMCSGAFQSSAMMNLSLKGERTPAPSSPLSPPSLPSHLQYTPAQQALSTPLNTATGNNTWTNTWFKKKTKHISEISLKKGLAYIQI